MRTLPHVEILTNYQLFKMSNSLEQLSLAAVEISLVSMVQLKGLDKKQLPLPQITTGVFDPFTTRSDHFINSPYNFNTLLSRQVMRIKKIIN